MEKHQFQIVMLVLRYINLHSNRKTFNIQQLLMQLAHIILDFSIYNLGINLGMLQGRIPPHCILETVSKGTMLSMTYFSVFRNTSREI